MVGLFLSNLFKRGAKNNMKVAIYCRLSDEDKDKLSKNDDSESIQNQKNMLVAYAVEHDWEIYNIYSDDDRTGADRTRPGFNKLLEDAENNNFNIVLCKSQSRFTREMELVEKYLHYLFPLWSIRFISTVDHADTFEKGNKKSRQINGLINEWYIEDLSENIKAVFRTKMKNGVYIGSFSLYGYMKDLEKRGHLIVDEEAASVVREVFNLYATGYGKTKIARMLNERGIPNPTEYKRLQGLRYKQPQKNCTLWKYYTISSILTNQMYIGNMVQSKYGSVSYKTKKCKLKPKNEWIIVEGTHEAIIDRELWDRVQKQVAIRAKPFPDGKIGLFTKKVRCMNCHYSLRSANNGERQYFKCITKSFHKEACPGAHIPFYELEAIVLGQLKSIIKSYADKAEIDQNVEFDNQIETRINDLEKQLSACQINIAYCSKAVKDLYMDKVKGIIAEDEFVTMSKDFYREKEKALFQANELKQGIANTKGKLNIDIDRKKIIEKYLKCEKLDREHVLELIDCIYVGKRDKTTKKVPVEIVWNF